MQSFWLVTLKKDPTGDFTPLKQQVLTREQARSVGALRQRQGLLCARRPIWEAPTASEHYAEPSLLCVTLLTARQHVSCQHNDTTEEQWQQGDCSLLVGLVTFHLAQSSDVHTKSGSENGDRDQNLLKIHKAIMPSFQVERDSCVVCTALPALETCNQQLWDVSLWVTRSASQETFSEQSVVQCQSWIVGAKKKTNTTHSATLHYIGPLSDNIHKATA